VAVVLIGGTLGFLLVEHLSPLDALDETLGIMSTAGGFDRPITVVGKLLAVIILIAGVAALFYTLGALAEYLIEGHFGRAIARHRMDRRIDRLRGHAIICGFGRVGRRIAQEFAIAGHAFVVVDMQEANALTLETAGYLYVRGDATEDATLVEAGIQRARSLLAATDADTENIAITLSARALAPRIWIVARANRDETEAKLRRAGADRVLSPYALGGHHMAGLARRPHLVDFLDTAMHRGDLDLTLEEIAVEPVSSLIGIALPASSGDLPQPLRDCTIIAVRPAGTQHWVAAVRRAGAPIGAGDYLIVLRAGDQQHARPATRDVALPISGGMPTEEAKTAPASPDPAQ
jgi:voltage-gated potassium channel